MRTTLATFARRFAANMVLEVQRMLTPFLLIGVAFLAGYGEGRGRHPTPVNTALAGLVVFGVAVLVAAGLIATFVQIAKERKPKT